MAVPVTRRLNDASDSLLGDRQECMGRACDFYSVDDKFCSCRAFTDGNEAHWCREAGGELTVQMRLC